MSKFLLPVLWFIVFSIAAQAQNIKKDVRHMVDSLLAVNPEAVGLQLHIEAPDIGISFSYAVGSTDRATHQKLLPNTPVLLASNTKPYVSAAILKLVELGKLDIDQPVCKLLTAHTNNKLIAAGYHTDKIHLKHLLSHTSGLRDYVSDNYFAFISSHKKYAWKREEQIALAAKAGRPLASPGDTFHYADINYVLLTEIIERQTKLPYYKAIRILLKYHALDLRETWFAKFEHAPTGTKPRAHQYWNKFGWDTYDLDPSWDLYGGGGIIATEKDMAMFFQKLFNDATIAVAVLEASHRPLALEISKEIVRQLALMQKVK